MTCKDQLRRLVEELPDDQADIALQLLEDLRNAADADGEPLDAQELASLDRGLADVKSGRVKPLEQYKRERGL